MEDLKALGSMGLVLPSAWYIVGAILFGLDPFQQKPDEVEIEQERES